MKLKLLFKQYTSEEVFTPATAASRNYIYRSELVYLLNNYIKTSGKQIIMFGYSGSGKTTLVKNELEKKKIKDVNIHCTQDTTFDQILLQIFDELNVYYNSSTQEKSDKNIGIDYRGLKSELSLTYSLNTERVVPPQVTSSKVATFLGAASYILILEDVHKLNNDVKIKIADLLKVFIDKANEYPSLKVICIGAVNSSKALIAIDPNLSTRVADLHVPLLTNEEIESLITNGFNLLGIKCSDINKHRIIELSNNIGSVAHQLCLNICHQLKVTKSNIWKSRQVTPDIIELAVKEYVRGHVGRFRTLIDKILAVKSIGTQILKTFKDADIEGLYFDQIKKRIKNIPEDEIKDFLKSLGTAEFEEVIRYDSNSTKFRLSNPFFQVYVKMFFLNEANKKKKRKYSGHLYFNIAKNDQIFQEYYSILLNSYLKDLK